MNITKFFYEIDNRINKLNTYINKQNNYKYFSNPFLEIAPKTYVWIENDNDKQS